MSKSDVISLLLLLLLLLGEDHNLDPKRSLPYRQKSNKAQISNSSRMIFDNTFIFADHLS